MADEICPRCGGTIATPALKFLHEQVHAEPCGLFGLRQLPYALFERIGRLMSDFAGQGWQAMDSAPRNGEEVLLLVEWRAGVRGKSLVGHYMPGGHCIDDHPPINAGWYFWNGCMFDRASKPIAWMRLPGNDQETKT